jgi:hypothetical protein
MPDAIERGRALLEKQNQQEEVRQPEGAQGAARPRALTRPSWSWPIARCCRCASSPAPTSRSLTSPGLIESAEAQAKAGKFEDAHKLLKGGGGLMGLLGGDKGAGDLAKDGQEASRKCVGARGSASRPLRAAGESSGSGWPGAAACTPTSVPGSRASSPTP